MDTNAGRISLSLLNRWLWGVEQITATEGNRFVVRTWLPPVVDMSGRPPSHNTRHVVSPNVALGLPQTAGGGPHVLEWSERHEADCRIEHPEVLGVRGDNPLVGAARTNHDVGVDDIGRRARGQ